MFQCGQWELIRCCVCNKQSINGKWAQIFRFRVNLKIYPPPWSQAKAGNGIQLYILCSFIYLLSLSIVSFGVEQVDRSVMLYDFIMLLFLLCITWQHIDVVVVVYYTSVTITTTRFIEIDYEVCVKWYLKTYCEANKFIYIKTYCCSFVSIYRNKRALWN